MPYKNPADAQAQYRRYAMAHREQNRVASAKWVRAHPEQHREATRKAYVKRMSTSEGRETKRKTAREWKQNNPEKVRRYNREHKARWYAADPRRARNAQLKKHFGITIIEWERMWIEQNGCCAACGGAMRSPEDSRLSRGKASDSAAVDHCHVSGKIRGLLHMACNTLIGMAEHDADRLRRIIAWMDATGVQPSRRPLERCSIEPELCSVQGELFNADHATHASTAGVADCRGTQ